MVAFVFGPESTDGQDISVGFTDIAWKPVHQQALDEWRRVQNISADLPVNLFRVPCEWSWDEGVPQFQGVIQLARACNIFNLLSVREVIENQHDCELSFTYRDWTDFTAGLLAYGNDADRFLQALQQGKFGGEISLVPSHNRFENVRDWSTHVGGLTALRLAARQAPAWETICRRLPSGELLRALADGQAPNDWEDLDEALAHGFDTSRTLRLWHDAIELDGKLLSVKAAAGVLGVKL